MQRIPKEKENSISQQELLMRVPLRQSVYKPQNNCKAAFPFLSSQLESQLPFWICLPRWWPITAQVNQKDDASFWPADSTWKGAFWWCLSCALGARLGKCVVKMWPTYRFWSWDKWRTLKCSPDAVNMSISLYLHQDHCDGSGVNSSVDLKQCSTWVNTEYPGGDHEAKVAYPSTGNNCCTENFNTMCNSKMPSCKTVQKNYITNKYIL